jgi:2-iminobutanoate/2-iminopropanoate deaminase
MTLEQTKLANTANANRQEYRVAGLAKPLSHYTDAVRFKDMLFISGLGAFDAAGNVVGADDVVEQTRQIFRNMQLVLDAAGADFSDILKVVVYVTDVKDLPRINPVRQQVFGEYRPTSTLVEVSRLALPEMKVEIEAVVGLRERYADGLADGSTEGR